MEGINVRHLANIAKRLSRMIAQPSINTPLPTDIDAVLDNIERNVDHLERHLEELSRYLDAIREGSLHHPAPQGGLPAINAAKGLCDKLKNEARQTSNHEIQLREEMERNSQVAESLARSNELFLSVLSNITDIVVVVHEKDILFCNNRGIDAFSEVNFDTRDVLLHSLLNLREDTGEPQEIFDKQRERYYLIKSMPMDWSDHGRVHLQIASDITESKNKEVALQQIAFIDELTGVPNRRAGLARLNLLMKSEVNYPICIVFIDMDGLKFVNDALGHAYGDVYIRTVADTITSAIRGNDFCARIGGDEFLVILVRENEHTARMVMQRVDLILSGLSDTPGYNHALAISYGIEEIQSYDGKGADVHITEADARMYECKKQRKGTLDR